MEERKHASTNGGGNKSEVDEDERKFVVTMAAGLAEMFYKEVRKRNVHPLADRIKITTSRPRDCSRVMPIRNIMSTNMKQQVVAFTQADNLIKTKRKEYGEKTKYHKSVIQQTQPALARVMGPNMTHHETLRDDDNNTYSMFIEKKKVAKEDNAKAPTPKAKPLTAGETKAQLEQALLTVFREHKPELVDAPFSSSCMSDIQDIKLYILEAVQKQLQTYQKQKHRSIVMSARRTSTFLFESNISKVN